ncbi:MULTISPECIES: hypothetical protein [unclassified Achromobacter]|nr:MULTISPECIES: hypothetical protein [unclassified Achromobacter]
MPTLRFLAYRGFSAADQFKENIEKSMACAMCKAARQEMLCCFFNEK